MDFETNERGNLIRPVPRLLQRVKAFFSAALVTTAIWYANGVDVVELLPSPAMLLVFSLLAFIFLVLFSRLQKELEFDEARQLVVLGDQVIAKFEDIRFVEIRQQGNDDFRFTVALQLLAGRQYILFSTNDDADASLNGAAVARVVGKPVQLTGI